MVRPRKPVRPLQFSSQPWRMLQDVVLSIVNGGLSAEDQNRIDALLALSEAPMPRAEGDEGNSVLIRTSFKTPHAFSQAVSVYIDQAVEDDGWMCYTIEEGGVVHTAYTSALFAS